MLRHSESDNPDPPTHAAAEDVLTMAQSEHAADRAALTLIVEARLPAQIAEAQGEAAEQHPQLSLLAGRGQLRRRWNRHDPTVASHCLWQLGLLETLQLAPSDCPSASIAALGADPGGSVDKSAGFWMHADPVHLAAGMDSLSFAPLTGVAAATGQERRALAPAIEAHMAGSPFRLLQLDARWFIHSDRQFEIVTCSPDAALAAPLDSVMPSGADARELRRLMTEWQMILHDHPVNEQRQRRGLPAINALWPWGGGVPTPVAASVAARALPIAYAADEFVKGLYRMHGAQAQSLPVSGESLIDNVMAPTIAVPEGADLAQVERNWIAPAVAALRRGRIASLDVWMGEWHLYATRGMLRRFWRKPLTLSGWGE